jgi:hypothetical protein
MKLRDIFKQSSNKTRWFFHKAFSNKSLWYFCLILFLLPFNISLLNLLGGFFYIEHPNLAITTTELINVSVSGWAIFTLFVRLNTKGIIPPETIRKSKKENDKLLAAMYFVPSARVSTYIISFITDGKKSLDIFGIEVNLYLILVIAVGAAIISGIRLYKLSRKRVGKSYELNQESFGIYPVDIQQTLAKFTSHLTEDEQSELSTLILHEEKIRKVTFINLIKICWNGLFLAWLFEVCVEALQRL